MKRSMLVDMNLLPCHDITASKARSFSYFFHLILFISATLCTTAQTVSEQQKSAYQKVITERAAKIVNTLSVTDSVKYKKVVSTIANQYAALNDIQENNVQAIAEIKKTETDKDKLAVALKASEEKKLTTLTQLHTQFIAHLKENLSDEKVDLVKDGMTYRVFPITYAAYQDMIPSLTAPQKEKIFDWLKEARELAMDAESSDKKHAVFGKYKGRINNYLSAEGYDVKKEGDEWAKRRQAAKEVKQAN